MRNRQVMTKNRLLQNLNHAMTRSTIHEPARDIPVARETDILVCGGGPAGIAAAFTAARAGARVLLLERHPFLGGVWTAGALTILIDTEKKPGLNRELRQRLEARDAATYCKQWPEWTVYGIEAMKGLLDEMAEETGIDVQLCTQVTAVAREGSRVTGVFTESKSGREFIRARIVIDTTGDGDVCARAGCPFEHGRPGDGKTQPMTLYGRIGGYRGTGAARHHPMLGIARKAGFPISYEGVTLFPQPDQPGVFMLMATHLWGSGIDVRNLTRAELQGRREIRQLVHILKTQGDDDWKDIYLIDTGPFLGVREARRILGRYYLTHDDLQAGRRFDDGICHVRFNVDIHHPDPEEGKNLYHLPMQPYDIPYRCLLPRDIDNLMMAGRCISGDHIAHSSYRVTGDAIATGEAAGLAAAIAVESRIDPPSIDIPAFLARLAALRNRHPLP
ncbi:flavoprotein involved in thiazole biosynthesis [Opitutaceae bacterium TAV1]|nr:flavoprotein involved in thiazole biosynthesis [Opitutaceae bacterium TAV1]